jgi:hypothetical protein
MLTSFNLYDTAFEVLEHVSPHTHQKKKEKKRKKKKKKTLRRGA